MVSVSPPVPALKEKNGVFGNSERRTQQWFKMVDPPGEARDDCWQTIAVARKLFDLGHPGMKDKDGKFLFHIADAAGKELEAWKWENYYGKVNVDEKLFEEYRQFTLIKHKDVVERVTFWGLSDRRTWRFGQHPLIFDASNQRKPAYAAITDAILRPNPGPEPPP